MQIVIDTGTPCAQVSETSLLYQLRRFILVQTVLIIDIDNKVQIIIK